MKRLVVWWLCLVSSVAHADVLLLGDVSDEDRALLRDAIGAALEDTILTSSDLRTRLQSAAERLGEDPTRAGTREALEEAHRGYVELRLGASMAAYGRALEQATQSEHAPADPNAIAQILFERSLVHLAAQRRDDAERDLFAALQLHPRFQPDANVYGAPVRDLVARARAARPRSRRFAVQRTPEDAEVRVNGQRVAPGEVATVQGAGPHLVTVTRDGFVPRSMLVSGRAEVRVRLREAPPALLAHQALRRWPEEGPPTDAFIARAAGIERIVRARAVGEQVELVLSTLDAEVVQQAAGSREVWEPRPYYVLAERLAGRTVDPPPADALPGVSLAVAAPDVVEPESTIQLRVTLRDPATLAATIAASCGTSTAQTDAREQAVLELDSPDDEGRVGCVVSALDARRTVLVRFPTNDDELIVNVAEPPANRVIWGVLGGALAAAAIGTAIALAFVLRDPQQVLVLEGLE